MATNDGDKDFDRVMRKLRRKTTTLGDLLAEEVLVSIRDGSTVTGAPGQPVASGALKKSWKKTRRGHIYRIGSTLFYAPYAEEGMTPKGGAFVQRSAVGGPHSVKLTRAGIQKLADNILLILTKAGG